MYTYIHKYIYIHIMCNVPNFDHLRLVVVTQ